MLKSKWFEINVVSPRTRQPIPAIYFCRDEVGRRKTLNPSQDNFALHRAFESHNKDRPFALYYGGGGTVEKGFLFMSMLDYPPASRILPSVDRARLFVPIRRKPSLLGLSLSLSRASMRDGRSSWLTGSETRSWFLHRGEDSLVLWFFTSLNCCFAALVLCWIANNFSVLICRRRWIFLLLSFFLGFRD